LYARTIEGRKHDFVPGLDPQRADRAADAARSDDADPEILGRFRGAQHAGQAGQGEAGGCGPGDPDEPAAAVIDGVISAHVQSPETC